MTPETKAIVIARAKSLAWRTGCVMVIAGISFISQQLVGLGLPPAVVGVLGLILGEVTKFVTDHTDLLGAKRIK